MLAVGVRLLETVDALVVVIGALVVVGMIIVVDVDVMHELPKYHIALHGSKEDENIFGVISTLLVSQLLMAWLNASAPSNILTMSVT